MRLLQLLEGAIPETDYGYWITDQGEFIKVGFQEHDYEANIRFQNQPYAGRFMAFRKGWVRVIQGDTRLEIDFASDFVTNRALHAVLNLIKTMNPNEVAVDAMRDTQGDKYLDERDPGKINAFIRQFLKKPTKMVAEAPINRMQVDPDFNANNLIQQQTWTGPKEKFRPDYRPVDVKALNDPGVLKKIETRFLKVPQKINLYFWTSREHPNAEGSGQKGNLLLGVVRPKFLSQYIDPAAAQRVLRMPDREQAITVVIANNLAADVGFVSLRSPWMVAHRIAHVLLMTTAGARVQRMFKEFLERTLEAYHVGGEARPEAIVEIRKPWATNRFVAVLAHAMGTTRAARDGNLNNPGEFLVESVVQHMLLGKARFNTNIPTELPYRDNPEDDALYEGRTQELRRSVAVFEKIANAAMAEMLNEAVGKILVM